MPANRALRVRVLPQPHTKYAYDWADGSLSSLIKAGSTTTSVVILTANFPANLKSAIDLGAKPRIQIISTATNSPVAPIVREVTTYQTDVPGVGDTTLIVNTAMPVAPIAGDYFYAGGPIVDPIATGIISYIDGLGPSRESGFADEFDVWEYQVTLARIADIVMEARDSDGTRMVRDIPRLMTTGLQLAVGAGAFQAVSFTPIDVLTPELAYLRGGGIEIVQYTV